MKDQFELRIAADGSIETIYQDGLAELLDATEARVCRASNVEWEDVGEGCRGWVVRSAKDDRLAIRKKPTEGGCEYIVSMDLNLEPVYFTQRELALVHEVRLFWDLLGWEHNPCPTHQQVGCMTCRYGEPPAACPVNCQGIDLGDGNWSGCSCRSGKLANGEPQPEGWQCDCPQHTGPNPCKEIDMLPFPCPEHPEQVDVSFIDTLMKP